MSAQSMLEQLLKSGLGMLEGKSKPTQGHKPQGSSEMKWDQIGAGALGGGALGMLLGGSTGGRKMGKAAKYGSVAALGLAAYKVYSQYQASQAAQQAAQPAPAPAPAWHQAPPAALPAPEVELHSRAMLQAMIAAAKADGHVDERERGLIEAELNRQEADPQQRQWFSQALSRPLDPAEVARAASTPELAAEMYLASVLVVDETTFMERAYLDELARQLRLPDGLKRDLEAQAAA
jgi:uncharacterized membrane protein YebE (DUF533 family)